MSNLTGIPRVRRGYRSVWTETQLISAYFPERRTRCPRSTQIDLNVVPPSCVVACSRRQANRSPAPGSRLGPLH